MSTNTNRQLRATGNGTYSESLKHAAFRGQTDRITELIAISADVNEPDCDGDTPLMLAAAQGHASIVAVLLRNGADVNVHNDKGETALHLAAYGGHTETVKALLAAGASVNARDNGGSTPLLCAAFGGHADVATALLGSGADAEIRNFGGQSARDLRRTAMALFCAERRHGSGRAPGRLLAPGGSPLRNDAVQRKRVMASSINFRLTIRVQFEICVRTSGSLRRQTRQFCPDGCILIVQSWGLRANDRWGLEVRDMVGPGVRAEAPVLSAFVALLMIVVGTVSIAVPLALAIILICS